MSFSYENADSLGSRRGTSRRHLFTKVFRTYVNFFTAVITVVLAILYLPSINNKMQNSAIMPSASASNLNVGGSGLTVSGISCGPGVRQFSWSKYAPLCIPKYTGKNGGATYNGVTPTTIYLSYREASASDLQELYLILHKNIIGTNEQAIETMNAYIKLFNKSFELYGRHVELLPFQGASDFIQEDTGNNISGAKADALTVATNLHAFADMSLVDASPVYDQYLTQNHVVNFTLYENTASFFQQNAPYSYSTGPNCTEGGYAIASIFAKAMSGLPAIYSGSPDLQSRPSRLGILDQSSPFSQNCARDFINTLENKFGITNAPIFTFTFNISQFVSESASIIAQLEQNDINTVACLTCDPISPYFLMSKADGNHYYPQWFDMPLFSNGTTFADLFGTSFPQSEFKNAISFGIQSPQSLDQEAYQAYLKTGAPLNNLIPSYPYIYADLLMFYDGLQAAGPDLTPQNFESGIFGQTGDLTTSMPGGVFGTWTFQPGRFQPATEFQITKWYPNAKRPQSLIFPGGPPGEGAFLACNNGQTYNYSDFAQALPSRKLLTCPPE